MPHLEPTYLRYIYDGLIKGSIHPENAAELPDGLIGLYEEAFDEKQPVHLRQQLLERFAIWALLKKEVSAQFVAEVLNQPEAEIQEFIATYSAWFNSPESGKYQLYHERLKVYFLQKLSEGEVAKLNNLIADFLLQKVNEVKQSESISYCFENLSFHLFLKGYLTGDSDLLAQYCLDENFKKRQFELSGYYDWEEQLMQLGVEYFALKEDAICHKIVFEKTKIQFKKKDIDLILSLIRNGEMETVFRFFQNIYETNLYARVEIAYFYLLSFLEIFEKEDWNFIKKKEIGSRLLEIFEDNFQWDRGYYLSQFVDVNISFRLHCYFEQFGLDFDKIACLSSNQSFEDTFEFAMDEPLRFIDINHLDEAKLILRKSQKYDYGSTLKLFESLDKSDYQNRIDCVLSITLRDQIITDTKTELINGFVYLGDEITHFIELIEYLKKVVKKVDLTRDVKNNVCRAYDQTIDHHSMGLYSRKGTFENSKGENTLEIIRKDIVENTIEEHSLSSLISNGLYLDEFLRIEPYKRYDLLLDENLNSDDDIELMLFFLDLSEHYQKEESSDLLNLLAALIIEFHLNMNDELIDNYINQLIELIESQFQESSEEFESKLFLQIIDFLGRNEINGYRRKTTEKIKDLLLEKYFDFNLYIDSFICGCKLINLFSKLRIAYQEDQIVERILEDLNFLIEENDYNDLQEIDCSYIDNIYQKKYFTEFYYAIKKVPVEEVRIDLSKYVFESILEVKGLNHKTVSFFKENSNEYPGMYLWVQKRLSLKLLEQNEYLSYVTIKDNNDLLLERLLLNIVSKREKLKDVLNIHILKHYGLDWVIELDQEYERLISINN
jgi:hypothetical protein